MAKILAPNKHYTGLSASVAFVNGEGHTDNDYLIEWFKKHGYEVIEDEKAPVPDTTATPIPLSKLKKDDLKELAKELGIEVPSKVSAGELVTLIEAKQAEDKGE